MWGRERKEEENNRRTWSGAAARAAHPDADELRGPLPVAREILGEGFVEHFVATREWEWRRFGDAVTDWELRRYFEII